MLLSAAAELGSALTDCLEASAGAYVLVRKGQRWRRWLGKATPEYRVNVRTRDGQECTITGATPVVVLQQAAARLRAARKE
jgi:hypothetical protein